MRNHKLIRIFTDNPLQAGKPVQLGKDQSHYLVNVMRLKIADPVLIFNNADGEFKATIAEASKNNVTIQVLKNYANIKHRPM